MLVHQPLDGAALDDMLRNDLGRVLGRYLVVEHAARVDDHKRAAGAEAVTARLDHADLGVGALRDQLFFERSLDAFGAGREAGGAEAHHYVHVRCFGDSVHQFSSRFRN
jgi:hypothetical protein